MSTRATGRALLALGCLLVWPGMADETAVSRIEAGRAAYDQGDFAAAAEAFAAAVALVPDDDVAVYWLGKAYGRQAERAGWFEAMRLARLTRQSLERAVALNPENPEAVRDLARYYDEAPGFLGGDAARAAELRARLSRLPRTR